MLHSTAIATMLLTRLTRSAIHATGIPKTATVNRNHRNEQAKLRVGKIPLRLQEWKHRDDDLAVDIVQDHQRDGHAIGKPGRASPKQKGVPRFTRIHDWLVHNISFVESIERKPGTRAPAVRASCIKPLTKASTSGQWPSWSTRRRSAPRSRLVYSAACRNASRLVRLGAKPFLASVSSTLL